MEEQAHQLLKVERLEALEAEVVELRRRLNLDSTNSSKPPSSDSPYKEPRSRNQQKRDRKRRGGQKGHKGSHRSMLPLAEVDAVLSLEPAGLCPECEGPWHVQPGGVQRHQVTHSPALKGTVRRAHEHGLGGGLRAGRVPGSRGSSRAGRVVCAGRPRGQRR